MAETRKITIELIQRNEYDAVPSPTPVTPEANNDTQTKVSSEGKMLLKSVILNQGYNTAKRLIIQGVESGLSNYFALSEDYLAENTYNNVKTSISKVTGFASSVLGGMTAGGMAGPVGAGVGAVIGAVGWGTSEFFSYSTRMSSYYRNLNASNIERDYFSRRAGLVNGGKGTEN